MAKCNLCSGSTVGLRAMNGIALHLTNCHNISAKEAKRIIESAGTNHTFECQMAVLLISIIYLVNSALMIS